MDTAVPEAFWAVGVSLRANVAATAAFLRRGTRRAARCSTPAVLDLAPTVHRNGRIARPRLWPVVRSSPGRLR
jgi:hypothetical protein